MFADKFDTLWLLHGLNPHRQLLWLDQDSQKRFSKR